MTVSDERLLEVFLEPIRICKSYKPLFGKSSPVDLQEFRKLYSSDFFYDAIGLSSDSMYVAHKAAGGMSSIYRQVGTGSERLVRAILGDVLGLNNESLGWSYEYIKSNGKTAIHTLDARVEWSMIDEEIGQRFRQWSQQALLGMGRDPEEIKLNGAVFEIRQGYKSADSKRQNADLRFGMRSYQADLLPVILVMSSQISSTVSRRYSADGMAVLTSEGEAAVGLSTYQFFKDVVGFDLATFFTRNSDSIKVEVEAAISALLSK